MNHMRPPRSQRGLIHVFVDTVKLQNHTNKMFPTLKVISFAMILATSGCATARLRMESSGFEPRTPAREQVFLRTSGQAGQEFVGNLVIDGNPRKISGVTPAEFPLTTCVMTGELRKVRGEGTLSFKIERANGGAIFGNLQKPGKSCRFGYHDGEVEVIGH